MRHIGIFIVILFVLFQSVKSQNGTLEGVVSDEDGFPLMQVNVILDASKGLATITDFSGFYSLSVPPGEYSVDIKYIGKEEKSLSVQIQADQTTSLNVTLADKAELINTVVVSASKYEKKLSEETVSMEVLKSNLIESNNIVNIEDGMNKVPGVTVTEGQANIRGGSGWSYGAGSRVMVLYDGLPLLTSDAQDTKWSFMPTENVEQVEVIKGAASSLYGSGALNGVINIRTGYAKSVPETKINVWSGVYHSPRDKREAWWFDTQSQPFFTGFNFVHRRKVKRFDIVVNGQYSHEKDDLKEDDSGDARIGGKFRYRPKNVEGLSLGVNVNAYRSWGSAFFLWDGPAERARVPLPNTASAYQNNRITVDPFLSFFDKKNNNYSFKMRYFNSKNTNNTGQGSVPVVYLADMQYNRYFIPFKFNIVAGMYAELGTIRSPGSTPDESLVGEHNRVNAAPYLQLEKKLFSDRLNLTFGTRYEFFKIDSKGDSSRPDTIVKSDLNRPLFRVGANLQVAEGTFLRASWGEGFRFPSIAEMFVNTNIGAIGIYPNPKLSSERGWYAEFGIKQGLKFGDWMGYIDVAAFVNRYENMMEFNFGQFGLSTDPLYGLGFSAQNVGDTRVLGAEISAAGQGKIGGKVPLQFLIGYTFVDPKSLNWDDELVVYNRIGEEIVPGSVNLGGFDVTEILPSSTRDGMSTYAGTSTATDNVLKYRNKHTFMADIQTSLKKWDFGVSVQFRSFMESVDYFFVSPFLIDELDPLIISVIESQIEDAGDFSSFEELVGTNAFSALKEFRTEIDGRGTTLLDARITYNFSDQAKITLVGKNLLNQTYAIRPTYLGSPMSFALQFNYRIKHK